MSADLEIRERNVVYFVGGHGQVKIGYTSNLANRISALSGAAGTELNVLRTIDGGRPTERWLHKKFAAYRTHGEWFEYHPDMMTVMPPDEITKPTKVTIRRDVRLTVKERLRDARRSGADIGLSDHLILTTFVASLNDDEARELMNMREAA